MAARKHNPLFTTRTHGMSNTPIYRTWRGMRKRCDYPKTNGYANYGGRGITYDPRWASFETFLADMGDKPSQRHELDRIDTDGNYCKENCRWVTRSENALNRRNKVLWTYRGQTFTPANLATHVGMSEALLRHRVRTLGYSVEDAVHVPLGAKRGNAPRRYEYRGESLTLSELAVRYGMHYRCLTSRLRRGMTLEQAMSRSVSVSREPGSDDDLPADRGKG